MKRVVILVPDEITRVVGRSDWSSSKDVPVDAESIVFALSTNEYHSNWYFCNPESIIVEEISDVKE